MAPKRRRSTRTSDGMSSRGRRGNSLIFRAPYAGQERGGTLDDVQPTQVEDGVVIDAANNPDTVEFSRLAHGVEPREERSAVQRSSSAVASHETLNENYEQHLQEPSASPILHLADAENLLLSQ